METREAVIITAIHWFIIISFLLFGLDFLQQLPLLLGLGQVLAMSSAMLTAP